MKKIVNCELNFEETIWIKRSRKVKQLIGKMLTKNYEKRISVFEVLNSEWMKSSLSEETMGVEEEMMKNLSSFYVNCILFSLKTN